MTTCFRQALQLSVDAKKKKKEERRGWEEYRCADVHSFHLLWAETSQMKRPAGQTGGAASVTHPSATFPFWIGLKLSLQSDALKIMSCFSVMQNKRWGIQLAGQTWIIWCPKNQTEWWSSTRLALMAAHLFLSVLMLPWRFSWDMIRTKFRFSWILKSTKNIIKEK